MPYEKSNKEIQESKVKGFKMKGSPMKRNFGIGADSPMKQDDTTQTYSGVTFDPTSSYDYKASPNIPSFRDIVSLEQQQAVADKVDKRRADEKKYGKEIEEAGLERNWVGKLTGDVFGGKKVKQRQELIQDLKDKEEKENSGDGWDYTDNNDNTKTTSVDEGGDFDDENPTNESSDDDINQLVSNVKSNPNVKVHG